MEYAFEINITEEERMILLVLAIYHLGKMDLMVQQGKPCSYPGDRGNLIDLYGLLQDKKEDGLLLGEDEYDALAMIIQPLTESRDLRVEGSPSDPYLGLRELVIYKYNWSHLRRLRRKIRKALSF